MPTTTDVQSWIDQDLVGPDDDKIGTVDQIYVDRQTGEPKFLAIKESSDNVRRITDLKILTGDRYALFCGVDDLVLEALTLGASGWVSGLVNAFPAENRLLWDLATSGRHDEAANVLILAVGSSPRSLVVRTPEAKPAAVSLREGK